MTRLCDPRLLLVVPLLLPGCGPPADRPVPVRGSVTVGGKPLAEGEVYFLTPGLVPAVLEVKEGRFEGEVKPGGSQQVRAYLFRTVAVRPLDPKEAAERAMEGPDLHPGRRIIPLNEDSPLTAEVTAQGPNEFSFDLPPP